MDNRYPYTGKVRLMVPFDPWRLLLTLRGVDVSTEGVCALLTASSPEMQEAQGLLAVGDPYDLQLEPDGPAAGSFPAPFVHARLARRARTGAGWELAFAFVAPDAELLGLVHELAARCARPS